MGSTLTNVFKGIYGILFLFSLSFVISNIDGALFDVSKLFLIIDYFIAIIEVVISGIGVLVLELTNVVVSALNFSFGFRIPLINYDVIIASRVDIATLTPDQITPIIQAMFPQSDLLVSTTIRDPITDFLNVWGTTVAVILLPVIILSGLGFITRGESKLAIYSFLGIQILIILSMYVPNEATATGRMFLIDLTIPTFQGSSNTFVADLITFISSQVLIIGLGLYILLEIAFQASYAISVVDPMIDREKRIKEHLRRIDAFKPTADKQQSVNIASLKSTSKKYDTLAASYLREMVEKKVFKRGSQQDQKTTMRLQSYIASLRRTDRQFERKITAISAQPNSWALIKNIIPLIVFRVLAVIVFAFIILNPKVILDPLIANPITQTSGLLNFPQLSESIELNQPEFRTVILFNVILFIIFISGLLHWLLVNKPEVEERKIKRVETLVDFQQISGASYDEDEDDEELEDE